MGREKLIMIPIGNTLTRKKVRRNRTNTFLSPKENTTIQNTVYDTKKKKRLSYFLMPTHYSLTNLNNKILFFSVFVEIRNFRYLLTTLKYVTNPNIHALVPHTTINAASPLTH